MRVSATWSPEDVAHVRALHKRLGTSTYQRRVNVLNLAATWSPPSADLLWDVYVACMLTTGTRSGAGGPVAALYGDSAVGDSPLGLRAVTSMRHRKDDIALVLRKFRVRFPERKAVFIASTYADYVQDGRCTILDYSAPELVSARTDPARADSATRLRLERQAAAAMAWGDNSVAGIGPKQARHVLKQLGLARETIVLDSRLIAFLRERGEEAKGLPGQAVLGDRWGFEMVEDWFIELARAVGITPVELDTLLWEAGGTSIAENDDDDASGPPGSAR